MKYHLLNLLLSVLFLSLTAFAQANDSTVVIKIIKEKYLVSRFVQSESVKRELEEKTRMILGDNTDFSQLKVQSEVTPFQYLWQIEFDASLNKIKSWKSGFFVFSVNKSPNDYPPIPTEIAESKIELADDRTVAIKDFNNKIVVLFLIESWCGPCRVQAEALRDFYPQIASRNVEIIAVSSDLEEKADFRKFIKLMKLPFNFGWIENNVFGEFAKISKFNAIPQVFIIKNGRLAGVFLGGGQHVNEILKQTILKIIDQNNLSK